MQDDAAISFDLDDELTAGSIATLLVRTPWGEIRIMGEIVEVGGRLHARGVHVSGVGPNRLGTAGLATIARAFAEVFDVDEILVEGAARTSGASPGRRPRPFRWHRWRAGGLRAAPERP